MAEWMHEVYVFSGVLGLISGLYVALIVTTFAGQHYRVLWEGE